jgi:DNA-binding PadR family transcriptional regulator
MIILGILANGPKTGYEIRQYAKSTTNLFWSELKFGHIYPALQSLDEKKLIKIHKEQISEGGKKTKSYKITEEGQKELNDWIINPNSIDKTKSETLAKLFFSNIEHVPLQVNRIEKMYRVMKENMEILLKQKEPLQERIDSMATPNVSMVFKLIVLEFGLQYFTGMKELTEKSMELLKKIKKD